MSQEAIDYRCSRYTTRNAVRLLGMAGSTLAFTGMRLLVAPWTARRAVTPSCLRRVAVLGFGGLGNHLMLLPALRLLRQGLPGAHLHLVAASPACADLFEHTGLLDSVSHCNVGRLRGLQALREAARRLEEVRADAVVCAAGLPPLRASLLAWLGGARVRAGADWRSRGLLLTHRVRLDGAELEARQNCRMVAVLLGAHMPPDPCVPALPLIAAERAAGEAWRRGLCVPGDASLVGLHPGSGKDQTWKRWDPARFAELAQGLEASRLGAHAVHFLGPDDADLLPALERHGVPAARIVMGDGSIRLTAARIAQCRVFVGNDSGLRQLAAALGVPTVAVVGPTSTAKNFPADGLHQTVVAARVRCRPCHYTPWWLACGAARPCLAAVTVPQLLDALRPMLEAAGRDGAGAAP
jgi:heptosyltransferase-2